MKRLKQYYNFDFTKTRIILYYLFFITLTLLPSCIKNNLRIKHDILPSEEYQIYLKILESTFIDSKSNIVWEKIKIYRYTHIIDMLKNEKIANRLILHYGDFIYRELLTNNEYNFELKFKKIYKQIKSIEIEMTNDFYSFHFSRVAYNKEKNFCIIYFADSSIAFAGHGYIVSLKKENDEWTVQDKLEIWIS